MNRQVGSLLRLEALVVLLGAGGIYARLDASWLIFALLLLAPDLSMVGYLRDPRVGARMYNAVHTYLGPALLGAVGVWLGHDLAIQIAVIWVSHIALDRLLGFGLKFPTGFGDTHLGTLKRAGSG